MPKISTSTIFKIWSADFVEEMLLNSFDDKKDSLNSDEVLREFAYTEQHRLIAEVYKYMMFGAELMVCLALGANVVAV